MNCTLCGHSFSPDEENRACQKCFMSKFCALVRCPNCGFEMPPEGDMAAAKPSLVEQCVQPRSFFGAPGEAQSVSSESAQASFTMLKDKTTVTADNKSSNSEGSVKKVFGWLAGAMGAKSSAGCCGSELKSSGASESILSTPRPAPKPSGGPGTSLMTLEPGRTARITRIDTSRRDGLRQLLALGLLPETEITLLRRFPTLVVQMGHSQFAIDRELAALVFVH